MEAFLYPAFQWNQMILTKGFIDSHDKRPAWQNYKPLSWSQWESLTYQFIILLAPQQEQWQSTLSYDTNYANNRDFFAVSIGIKACQCYSLWPLCCFWSHRGCHTVIFASILFAWQFSAESALMHINSLSSPSQNKP